MKKTSYLLLAGILVPGLACFVFYLSASVKDAPSMPSPTEWAQQHREDKAFKEERRDWIEQMHRTAPGTNWRAVDAATRWRKAQERFERISSMRGSGHEDYPKDVIAGSVIAHWREVGSKNQAGRIHLAEYDTSTQTLYLASSGGNIWKGNLQGDGWEVLNDFFQLKGIQFMRKLNVGGGTDRLLIGTTSWDLSPVWYSDDEGLTWTPSAGTIGAPAYSGRGLRFLREPGSGDIWTMTFEFTAGGRICLYRSQDDGLSFTSIDCFSTSTFGNQNQFDIWTDKEVDGPLFMLRGDEVLKRESNGSWNSLSTINLQHTGGNARLSGRIVGSDTVLYAIYDADDTYIYRSGDAGQTWAYRGNVNTGLFYRTSQFVSLDDVNTLYVGGIDTWKSTDGGINWNRVNNWWEYYDDEVNKLHADIPSIQAFRMPDSSELSIVNTDGGTYTSTDQLQTVLNISLDNLNVSQYYSSYTHQTEPRYTYVGAQDQGFQRSNSDPGETVNFEQVISGDYGHLGSADNGNSLWANYPGFTILFPDARFSDNSVSRDFDLENNLWLAPLLVDPTDPNVAYLGGGHQAGSSGAHLVRLQYTGGSIGATQLAYDFSLGTNASISAMGISPLNPAHRYVLTDNEEFFYSTNSGGSWTHSGANALPGSHYFYGNAILPSPVTAGRVYIAGSGYNNPPVYLSTDHGQTFIPAANGLPSTLVYDLATTPDERMVFAATEVGPYVYFPDQNQWYPMEGDHAPDQTYWNVEYVEALNVARFVTYGRGIWDFTICDSFSPQPEAKMQVNQLGDTTRFFFFNQSENAYFGEWIIDDSLEFQGSLLNYQFDVPGAYEVKLIASNHCSSDTLTEIIVLGDTTPPDVDPPVSIDEGDLATDFTISPNPSNGQFSVQWDAALRPVKALKVLTLTGQQVYEMPLSASQPRVQLQLGHIAAGIYLLQLEDHNGRFLSRKLIIRH